MYWQYLKFTFGNWLGWSVLLFYKVPILCIQNFNHSNYLLFIPSYTTRYIANHNSYTLYKLTYLQNILVNLHFTTWCLLHVPNAGFHDGTNPL